MVAVSRSLLAALGISGLCMAGWMAGCMPVHAAFLQLRVAFPDGTPAGLTIVDVPLTKLRTRRGDLDPQRIAVYHTGRNPLPYRLLDKDSDGRPDHLRVKFVPDANQAWLVFVSPGEASPAELPAGGHEVPVTYQ